MKIIYIYINKHCFGLLLFTSVQHTLRIIELPARASTYKEILNKNELQDVSVKWRSSSIFKSMISVVTYPR